MLSATHYSVMDAKNTHKLPTLWFVSVCAADKQAVLKLLNDSDDIFTGTLQHRACYHTHTPLRYISFKLVEKLLVIT